MLYIKAVKINEYKKYTFYSSHGKCILFKYVKMLKDNVEVTPCVQTFISKDAKNHSGVPTINCHLLAWCTFTWPYLSVCIKRTACIQFCKHVQVVYMQFSFSICYHILYDCMLYFPITRLVWLRRGGGNRINILFNKVPIYTSNELWLTHFTFFIQKYKFANHNEFYLLELGQTNPR